MPNISKDFLQTLYYLAVESLIQDLTEEEKKKVPSFDDFVNSLVITKKKIKIKNFQL